MYIDFKQTNNPLTWFGMLLAGLKQNTGMHYVVALLRHVTAALALSLRPLPSLQLRPVRAWYISSHEYDKVLFPLATLSPE